MPYLFTTVYVHVCVCFHTGMLDLKTPLDSNCELSDASVIEFGFSPFFFLSCPLFLRPPLAFSDALTCIDKLEFSRL